MTKKMARKIRKLERASTLEIFKELDKRFENYAFVGEEVLKGNKSNYNITLHGQNSSVWGLVDFLTVKIKADKIMGLQGK